MKELRETRLSITDLMGDDQRTANFEAKSLFMKAYQASGVAKAAGVSKATLYSYVPDKKLLFLEVAKAECLAQADAFKREVDNGSPREVLMEEARRINDMIVSPFGAY